jgi:hypothetical protein
MVLTNGLSRMRGDPHVPDGRVVLRKKLNRGRLLEFFAKLPLCVVAMHSGLYVVRGWITCVSPSAAGQ